MITFDTNAKRLCYFTGISMCVYVSYNANKRCTKETFLKCSDVYGNVFSVLRSIPLGTIDINLDSCILNRHKLRQLQIATNQEFLPSQFVICHNLWSRPWRDKLSYTYRLYIISYLGQTVSHHYTLQNHSCIYWAYPHDYITYIKTMQR